MGMDKSMLVYHDKPQRYHVHDLLLPFCEKVFLSLNNGQDSPAESYEILRDDSEFENIGPMAALLTAFSQFPEQDFLVIGCDYPFLTGPVLEDFVTTLEKGQIAAAFYNKSDLYEPLLAWYSNTCNPLLQMSFKKKEFSLQHFLKFHNAAKYRPENQEVMKSVDTYGDFQQVIQQLDSTK